MRIIVLGPPGVGKGTYTQELVKELGLIHISTGDIFRENIKNKTLLGKQVEGYLASGKLVPDEITTEIIKNRLNQKDCKKGFIIDGYPRTLAQAESLEKIVKIDLVLNFKADKEIIISRLSGRRVCKNCKWIYHIINIPPKKEGKCDRCPGELFHRPDDMPETISRRLETYEKETAPLIDYYKHKKILKEVTVNEEFGKYKEIIMDRILKVISN